MKVLFVNKGAGKAKKGRELEGLLKALENYPEVEIRYINGATPVPDMVKQALKQGAQLIGVAGGDGTVNAVASALVGTDVPLVVIPFGTLNHFARDIGAPDKPEEALKLFEEGCQRRVDVGEVNGCYFLNNSSVGLYPTLVKQREKYEKWLGKWLAYGLAGWIVLRHPRLMHIKLAIGGKPQDLKAGVVFFSNNRTEMSPLEAGHRPRLDEQILDTYILKASSPFELFRVAASFLRNRLEESPFVAETEVGEAKIYSHRGIIRVACDGEVQRMRQPLCYKINPEALVVQVPVEQPQVKEEKSEAGVSAGEVKKGGLKI